MDREAWRATVHRVEKSRTQLTRLSMHTGRNITKREDCLYLYSLASFCLCLTLLWKSRMPWSSPYVWNLPHYFRSYQNSSSAYLLAAIIDNIKIQWKYNPFAQIQCLIQINQEEIKKVFRESYLSFMIIFMHSNLLVNVVLDSKFSFF